MEVEVLALKPKSLDENDYYLQVAVIQTLSMGVGGATTAHAFAPAYSSRHTRKPSGDTRRANFHR